MTKEIFYGLIIKPFGKFAALLGSLVLKGPRLVLLPPVLPLAILHIVQYIILQAAVAGLNSYIKHDLSCIGKLYMKSADSYTSSYI